MSLGFNLSTPAGYNRSLRMCTSTRAVRRFLPDMKNMFLRRRGSSLVPLTFTLAIARSSPLPPRESIAVPLYVTYTELQHVRNLKSIVLFFFRFEVTLAAAHMIRKLNAKKLLFPYKIMIEIVKVKIECKNCNYFCRINLRTILQKMEVKSGRRWNK